MKRVAIVMTYFNRQHQLNKTLKSIAETKHNNFEVIIVDDGSETPPEIGLSDFKITVLQTKNKTWTNPEPAYNLGLKYAMVQRPDVIIVQNAECYHVNDVISKAAQIQDNEYYSFSCFSIDQKNTFRGHDIMALIMSNEIGASRDGQNAWYNHPVFRPVAYDFCAAINVSDMKQLNGYDERFSSGCGYGDDYFLARVRALGLDVKIITNSFVVHQWHYTGQGVPENKDQLVARNKMLFSLTTPIQDVKAVHLYTENL